MVLGLRIKFIEDINKNVGNMLVFYHIESESISWYPKQMLFSENYSNLNIIHRWWRYEILMERVLQQQSCIEKFPLATAIRAHLARNRLTRAASTTSNYSSVYFITCTRALAHTHAYTSRHIRFRQRGENIHPFQYIQSLMTVKNVVCSL